MKRGTFFRYTAPSNIVMVALMTLPLVMAVWLGLNFITFRTFDTPNFVGLANYLEVLSDVRFWQALEFTLLIAAICVPVHITIGLVVALLLDQIKGKMRDVFLPGMLMPMIVVPVVGTLMFRQLFEPAGLFAWFFSEIVGQRFIFTEPSVKALIIMHTIWVSTPFALLIFFAGLQTLPGELVDASGIDGANRLQQIRYVVIPHLRSLIVLEALVALMDFYRLFDSVFILTELNPIFKADSVLTYNFKVAMTVGRLGKGSAMAILTVIGIFVVVIPFLILTYREQIEER
ncbi:carbohydrate ABC transporter permease [Candidatus Leptofilum sp.]|uniref:carbohydrate ABC transporter permease n=1 Tax=Candidatus Leptofilum sp. TaxID=3241576 RepID=UPI003B5C293A